MPKLKRGQLICTEKEKLCLFHWRLTWTKNIVGGNGEWYTEGRVLIGLREHKYIKWIFNIAKRSHTYFCSKKEKLFYSNYEYNTNIKTNQKYSCISWLWQMCRKIKIFICVFHIIYLTLLVICQFLLVYQTYCKAN